MCSGGLGSACLGGAEGYRPPNTSLQHYSWKLRPKFTYKENKRFLLRNLFTILIFFWKILDLFNFVIFIYRMMKEEGFVV